MGEMFEWSHEVGFGTPKHPPLGAWIVRAWFSVMPREDWAYYLLAIILPTLALWVSWRIFEYYLPRDKRVLAVIFLTLTPFYNLLALKYNANTILTPIWAATTWWFLRSFETRQTGWAILAGVGAAAAMLGKYWSVLLLGGLALAILTDRRRGAYFSSPAPYITVATGAVLIIPHVDWLISHKFISFSYAIEAHTTTFLVALASALRFLGGSILYVSVPIACSLLIVIPQTQVITDTLWPAEPERRTLVFAFILPLLLAPLCALVMVVEIHSLWAMCAMTLLPIVLLSSSQLKISRRASSRILVLALVFPGTMLAASPLIALSTHLQGTLDYRSDYRMVAQATEHVWSAHTNLPLQIVAGATLQEGIVFYFDKQPSTFNVIFPNATPWVDDDRIRKEGLAIVCPENDRPCEYALKDLSAQFHAVATERVAIARSFLGIESVSTSYVIAVIPPSPGN